MADSAPPPDTTGTPPPPDATASAPPPADTTTTPPPAGTTVTPPPPDTSSSAPPPAATESSPPPAVTTPPLPALAPPVAASPPPAAALTPPAPQTAASPPPSSTVASPPPASTTVSPPPPSSTPSTPSNSSAPPPSTTTASPPPAVLTPPPPGALHSAPPPSSLPSSPPPPTSSTNSTTPSTPTTPSTTTPSSPGGSSTNYSAPPTVSSSPPPSDGGGLSTGAAAAVGVIVAAFVLAVVGICICYTRKKRRPHMEGYQQGYPNGFGMPNSAQFPQQGYPNSGEAPFLMSSPSRATSGHYSGGLPPNSKNYSGGPNYNNSNGFSNNSNSYTNNSKSYSQGGRMRNSMTDLNVGSNQSCFEYQELYDITGGFAVENILGEGGFGCVYKGKLADGKEVAVKELKGGGGQGEREFQAEVEIISRVHHRHLVSLVGFCISEDHRLLVYDFVSNGTLHFHIHGKGRPCMEWSTRVKVAAGSARGLAYLHEDCHPKIIHRDIKSANILIDDHFEAQVADFGLARLTDTNATHVSTRVMGTFGYLAPEYASTGKLTDKSDVFSFGVVLLELITGRKPVDGNRPVGEESLVEWARPLLGQALESGDRDFKELVDPKLGTNYKEVEMFRMIETAAACIRHSASRRPKMSQVVRVLDSLTDEVDISNGVQPGKSQMFNVANTADIRLFQKMAFGSQEFSSDSHTQSESSRNF